jgi:SWI/SNF-related matrix-associated actin-dependent regulator 1 of chromatin subfamily A
MINITLSKTINLNFRYDPEIVAWVKENFEGRKWDPTNKLWIIPTTAINLLAIKNCPFEIENKENIIKELELKLYPSQKELDNNIKLSPDGLELFPFQKEMVKFIDSTNCKCLITEQMGLGKSIEAISYLNLHPEIKSILIICPASLKINWKRELQKWLIKKDKKIIILTSKNLKSEFSNLKYQNCILIINFDILDKLKKEIKDWKPELIIVDEAHKLKNIKTKRYQAFEYMFKNIDKKILMTGTPIMNRPVEIFPLVHYIKPDEFENFWNFAKRYCGATSNGYGWGFKGAENLDELRYRLRRFMLGRTKKEVMKDLPEKIRSVVELSDANGGMKGSKELEKKSKDLIEEMKKLKNLKSEIENLENQNLKLDFKDSDGIEKMSKMKELMKNNVIMRMVEINSLMRQAVEVKFDSSLKFIIDIVEQDEKVVLFCWHKDIIKKFEKVFQEIGIKYVKITGEVSLANRDKAVQDFQNNPDIKIFIGNIQAAGVGLTLTAANKVVFIEFDWSPANMLQAEDRCHRISQKNAVNIYYLVIPNSIEVNFLNILFKKLIIVNKIMENDSVKAESSFWELVDDFINNYKEESV